MVTSYVGDEPLRQTCPPLRQRNGVDAGASPIFFIVISLCGAIGVAGGAVYRSAATVQAAPYSAPQSFDEGSGSNNVAKGDRLPLPEPLAAPTVEPRPLPRKSEAEPHDRVCGQRGRTWYHRANGWAYWRCNR